MNAEDCDGRRVSLQSSCMNDLVKARVFLSCGQRKNDEEARVAERVRNAIAACGFECYMAIAANSPRSLRENIFKELEIADYFVFIDFKRERLDGGASRGSLFVNQELGIASFLEIPLIGFQEVGVKDLDGMLGAIQANAVHFSDREQLHIIVATRLQEKLASSEWTTQTRNCLTLCLPEFVDSIDANTRTMSRYFQIRVNNNHARKPALGCFVYLESIEDLQLDQRVDVETVEFKWSGSALADVRIGPRASRRFDAFQFPIVPQDNIGNIKFNLHTDSTQFIPWQVAMPGKYGLVYTVVSENFPVARGTFILEFSQSLQSIRVSEPSDYPDRVVTPLSGSSNTAITTA
jgi:hypothetical protein